jgi:hypothetical protein
MQDGAYQHPADRVLQEKETTKEGFECIDWSLHGFVWK